MQTQYLTYNEFRTWGLPEGTEPPEGTMSEPEFMIAEFRARKRIDYWTDSRVKNMETVPEAVKHCMMAMIKLDTKYGAEAQIESPLLSSFNNDGYSESYGSAAERTATMERQLSRELARLLYGVKDDNGVPLLYRGVM